jgi:O-antigen ligase
MKKSHQINLVKLILNVFILGSLFIMGMQFTPYQFMSKESLVGPLVILTALLIYYLVFNRNLIVSNSSLLIISLTLVFFTYYILNINTQIPLKPDYMLYLIIIFLTFLFISIFKNEIILLPVSIIFVFLYINILFLPRLISYMSFTNANSNGIIAFLLLFFCIINIKESNIILRIMNIYNSLFLITALFIATSRAAMLAFLVVIFIYLIVKKLHKYIFALIASIIIASQAFIFIYTKAKNTSLGTVLNDITVKFTGKNLFSGRDRIWREAVDEVIHTGDIWTGVGNNTQYAGFNGYLHNLYVQLFYQSGFIGVLLISALILAIAFIAMKVKTYEVDHKFKVFFAYFVGILVLQIFEGHLIYKFEIITMLCWIIIALFVNKILMLNINNKNTIS